MKFSKRFIPNEYLLEADPSAKMQQLILQESGSGLSEPPNKEAWTTANEVDLSNDNVSELRQSPYCPSLIALYLQEGCKLTAIPPLFFQRMALLRVLDLSRTSVKSLPNSLTKLVALKKLLLRGCLLFMELSPQVGELGNLEELDLDETQIMDLPREIGKLLALRHLRVSFYPICGKKKLKSNIVIPPETISKLSQLTHLSIDVDPVDKRWDDSVEVVVKEVCNSKTLRTLSLHLPKFELLQYMSSIYPSLSGFSFIVGHIKRRIISRVPQEVEAQFRNQNKCLKFVNDENIPNEIKGVLKYSNSFFLDNHATAMNLSEFGIENMKWLKCCLLAECNKMKTIIDGKRHCQGNEDYSGENVALQSLEYLGIYYMENLGNIWTGPTRYGYMSKLKFLSLHSCPQLSNVFSHSLLENLINLEEFILEDCPLVTSLVSDAFFKPIMSYEFLPSLKRLLLLYLPELVNISNGLIIAPKLECIGFYNCPKLKRISKTELSSNGLKIIKGERRWWDDMKWNETEWGNRPEYLMRIFSPINNEEDVMTQMAKDRVFFEISIRNEALQLEYTKDIIIGTDSTRPTPRAPERKSSFSSYKNKRPVEEDDELNLASEICEVDDNEDEPRAKRWNCNENENKGVIYTERGTFQRRSELDVHDDGCEWRKYEEEVVELKGIPSRMLDRSYYRCIVRRCPVKKKVERDSKDTSYLVTTYEGKHNHDWPKTIIIPTKGGEAVNGWSSDKGNFSVDLKLGQAGNAGDWEPRGFEIESSPSKRARPTNNGIHQVSCLLEGCNSDLRNCTYYSRRHNVCEFHARAPQVMINGLKQRFCDICCR